MATQTAQHASDEGRPPLSFQEAWRHANTLRKGMRRQWLSIDWELFFARTKCVLWKVLTKLVLGLIYLTVISEGLRMTIPPLTVKLYKIIPLKVLRRIEFLHNLDLAVFFSLGVMVVIFSVWPRAVRYYLGEEFDNERWDPERQRWLIVGQGVAILVIEPFIFYRGVSKFGWTREGISVSALLATVAYVVVLVFITHKTVELEHEVSILKEKRS